MTRFADRIQKWTEHVLAALLALMAILLLINVVARYFFHTGIAASDEIARLSFVWMVFLGAAVAVRDRAHIGIDMVVRIMPRWAQRTCLIFTHLLVLYAVWLFASGSWTQTLIGMNNISPMTRLPVAVFSAAGLVGSLAMGVLYAVDLFRVLTGKMRDDDLVHVQETPDQAHVPDEPSSDQQEKRP